jgi:hypothetical protein
MGALVWGFVFWRQVPYYAGATCGLYAQKGDDPLRVFPQAPSLKIVKIGSTTGPFAKAGELRSHKDV